MGQLSTVMVSWQSPFLRGTAGGNGNVRPGLLEKNATTGRSSRARTDVSNAEMQPVLDQPNASCYSFAIREWELRRVDGSNCKARCKESDRASGPNSRLEPLCRQAEPGYNRTACHDPWSSGPGHPLCVVASCTIMIVAIVASMGGFCYEADGCRPTGLVSAVPPNHAP